MKRLHLLALLGVAALGILAWDLSRTRQQPATAPAGPVAAANPAGEKAGSPAAPQPPGGPQELVRAPNFLRPARVSMTTSSPLSQEFGKSLAYKPIYERLKGTPEGATPEGQYYLYRILRACATVADRRAPVRERARNAAVIEERRQQIAAGLPETDPRRALRLEAFDKVNADVCEGLSGLAVTEAELGLLLQNALAGGDPKALAWQVEQDLWRERRSARPPGSAGPTLGEEQLASLREAFSSRDPEAMIIAGRVLAHSFRDLTVRVGPDREVIENRAFSNAAQLLACEYGYACADNNSRVLEGCAYQGHCGVASLADYLFYYGASPHEAQLLDRYRTLLRQAVDTGDWSMLEVERGSRSPNSPLNTYRRGPIGR